MVEHRLKRGPHVRYDRRIAPPPIRRRNPVRTRLLRIVFAVIDGTTAGLPPVSHLMNKDPVVCIGLELGPHRLFARARAG